MVNRSRIPSKHARTGVAISATELVAVDARLRGGVWRAPLDPPPSDMAHWPSLATALSDLSRMLGDAGGTVDSALMPPLAEVRRLTLPPMREDDMRRLLSRNASKYFVGARSAQIVGVSLAPIADVS
ncbi:MAG: hypothetical protein LBQ09_05525, partial [Acidobacteriaceae bacterium]|nr:hypothetical protein [Acidobacteriaceae bacterium]